jgi:hypothetical protein
VALPVPLISAAQAYETLRAQGLNTRSYFNNLHQMLTSAPQEGETEVTIDSQYFMAAITSAANTLALAQEMAADETQAEAFGNYVRQMSGNPDLDVHTELTTSMTALGSAIATMIAVYPQDANGFLLDRHFDASGRIVTISLTATSLATADGAMLAWLATIT